jgi:hypothetical protein
MEMKDYKTGDQVRVKMNNPRLGNKEEWRDGEVVDNRMIYPNRGERHAPYPMVIVRVTRTYCKATPMYRWINGNIPVFVDNTLEFYEKQNEEGFLYNTEIMLKDDRAAEVIVREAMNSIYTVPEEFKKKV